MPLTGHFGARVQDRITWDPDFGDWLFEDRVECLLTGEVDVGKSVPRDYVNASIGFQGLGGLTHQSPKSLMRMLDPCSDPQVCNLFEIVSCVQELKGLHLKVKAGR